MKLAGNIAGGLLGLLFIVFGTNFFLHFLPAPPPPAGSAAAAFMTATATTGWLGFVHFLEIVGGVLVAIPQTRALGLLVLGPIVINILCFHVFVTRGGGIFPAPIVVAVLCLFLLYTKRHTFAALLPGRS